MELKTALFCPILFSNLKLCLPGGQSVFFFAPSHHSPAAAWPRHWGFCDNEYI